MAVLEAAALLLLLLALFLPKAGPALAIGGAFGGCLVDFFCPALMWFRLSKRPKYDLQNIACLVMPEFGLVRAAVATYISIVDAIAAFG
jgi:hypothetical protein